MRARIIVDKVTRREPVTSTKLYKKYIELGYSPEEANNKVRLLNIKIEAQANFN